MYLIKTLVDPDSEVIMARKLFVSDDEIDGAPAVVVRGVLVLGKSYGETIPELKLVSDGTTFGGGWASKETNRLRRDFPDALNSAHARFSFLPIPSPAPAKLMLALAETEDTKEVKLAELIRWPSDTLIAIRTTIEKTFNRGLQGQTEEAGKLQSALKKFSRVEKETTEWMQCQLLLDAVHHRNPWRTLKRISAECSKMEKQGRDDEVAQFKVAVQNATYPNVLTTHGYSLSTFQAMKDHTPIWDNIGQITAKLKDLGYACFINSGTLLGATRDGKLIGHDDDVDLALILKATSAAEAAQEWYALKGSLIACGLFDVEAWKLGKPFIFKLKGLEGTEFDLFPGWTEGEKVFVYPHTFGELEKRDVFPLVEGPFPGMLAPKKPELMLELNYGKNWRTPDPSFHFPWESASKKFGPFLRNFRKLNQVDE